ncbi:MAG: hypothetical protein GEV03_19365 [Streptosporangiales bacterium]|nr:hypothetical protein [Streptosporangiales bacterium]
MTVSIPIIFIFGAIAFVAVRYMGLRVRHAIVCLLIGFLLAATSAAPAVQRFLAALVQATS